MYGSSLRMETLRPRALRILPTLAAVMPLPREEVTPPVTKTYFAMGQVLRGFFQCYRVVGRGATGWALSWPQPKGYCDGERANVAQGSDPKTAPIAWRAIRYGS